MTDITTTAQVIEQGQPDTMGIVFPPRPAMVGELARAQAAEAAALQRAAEAEAEVQRLRTEQILDGADPRLVGFWDKAGRIADYADFCDEYDRLAEELNGVPREREFEVRMEVELTFTVYKTVTARNEDDAEEVAREDLDRDDMTAAIDARGYDSLDISDLSAERR